MVSGLTAACRLGARTSRPPAGLKARVPGGRRRRPGRLLFGDWGPIGECKASWSIVPAASAPAWSQALAIAVEQKPLPGNAQTGLAIAGCGHRLTHVDGRAGNFGGQQRHLLSAHGA